MEKQSLRWSTDGDPTLLVIEVPEAVAPFGLSSPSFGLPIMRRQGGLLVAVPLNAVDSGKLVDEMTSEGDGLLGPSKSFTTELTAEEEEGAVAYLGVPCRFMVIDFSDDILLVSREYSPEQDSIEMILPFHQDYPTALPNLAEIPEKIKEWVAGQNIGRAHFYSAREEQDTPTAKAPATKKAATPKRITDASMAEQLAALQVQVQALAAAQIPKVLPTPVAIPDAQPGASGGKPIGASKMPALSSAFLGGPPSLMVPSVKKAGWPPSEDYGGCSKGCQPSSDTSGGRAKDLAGRGSHHRRSTFTGAGSTRICIDGISGPHSSWRRRSWRPVDISHFFSKHFYKRRATKRAIAERTSQWQQQLLPSAASATTSAVAPQPALAGRRRRLQGYRHLLAQVQKTTGVALWLLGYVLDALIQDDTHRAREHLALAIAALEQQGIDGDFTLGYLIALVEEPPIQLYQDRTLSMHAQGRPFAPLVPPSHAAGAISYLKELEVLNSRKKETVPAASTPKSTTRHQTAHPPDVVLGIRKSRRPTPPILNDW